MTIVRCDSRHDERWAAFVASSPRCSFYHRLEWKRLLEEQLRLQTAYLAAIDGEQIVGVLPLVRLKSLLFGNVACSMPFVNYGGPAGLTDDIEAALVEAAGPVLDEWGVAYLEIRSVRHLGDRYPCSEHKVSMTIALDRDPETVMNGFRREQRAEIRKALKQGFETRFGNHLVDDFYDVLSVSWRDLGTPIYSRAFMQSIVATFPDHVRICVVYDAQGKPAAAAFDGLHNGTVEGMWLGMRPEYRRQLVGYVLYWELIKHACTLGFEAFHLGRSSKDSGGEQFKKKWNAAALQLHWQYVLRTATAMPALNPDNPKYRLAIEAWRRLPVPVTQALGPFIARSIP